MANRLTRIISFAFEPNLCTIFGKVSFGAAGAPTLDTKNSKGICNVSRKAIAFTGDIANTSATINNVSSYAGLYVGMTLTGTGIPASTTISSMNAGAATITMSQAATATTVTLAISAAGGQFLVQFGQQAAVRLDTYNKLSILSHVWDETGLQGGASTAPSSPAAPAMFIVSNAIATRTIPNTTATVLTDATIGLIFGTLSAGTFVAKDPGNGEIVRLRFSFVNSTAI